MKKKAFATDLVTRVTTNGYVIEAFSFQQHDPNNENTIQVSVIYSLASFAADGAATVSAIPEHRGITLRVSNVGDNRYLHDWLAGNGSPGDPLRFDYHDLERLIEDDIERRFGMKVK